MSDTGINPGPAPVASRPAGADTPRLDSMRHAAQEFEAIFLTQVLGTITHGLGGDDLLGDGQGDPFRAMLNEEVAKLISRSGGIGVADAVLREMLKAQEVA
jgi:Rod binding domain-containing protein